MATNLQKAAVERIVEKRGKNKKVAISKVMTEVGYAEATAVNPKNLTDSKGFKEILEGYGLTEGLITKALVDDIKAKPGKRFLELSLGSEILGMKKREIPKEQDRTVVAVQIIVNGTDLRTEDTTV